MSVENVDHTVEVAFPPGITTPEQRENILMKRLSDLEAIVKKERRKNRKAVKHIRFYLRTKVSIYDKYRSSKLTFPIFRIPILIQSFMVGSFSTIRCPL